MQAKPSPEIVVNAALTAFRIGHIARIVATQRHTIFADGRKVSGLDNVLYVVGLISAGIALTADGTELARRVTAGQPLLAIEACDDVNTRLVSSGIIDLGMSIATVSRGQVPFTKRRLSTYGRVYHGLLASATASRLGLHAAAIAKSR